MTHGIFTTLFSQPLYNGLIFLMKWVPMADAGIAIILFTVIVRSLLYPLTKRSIITQLKMRGAEKDIERIKSQFKDRTEQATEMMKYYKEIGLNPFSGFLLILIQIPIIFALYKIFLQSGLPQIDPGMLYSFVSADFTPNMNFLGIVDISSKSLILALMTAVSQFFQIRFSLPPSKPAAPTDTFKDNLARSMNMQMKYFFPIIAFFIVYNLSGTIALYWTTNNIVALIQEWYIRRRYYALAKTNDTSR